MRVDQQHTSMDALDLGIGHRTRLRKADTEHNRKKA
jgi:hypothetical protein